MARKRYSDEDCLKVLREIEVHLAGGMARSDLAEKKALEKENQRLKKIVAELELDELILKETIDFLKPKG